MINALLRILSLILFATFCPAVYIADCTTIAFGIQAAHAQAWKDEFNEICGKTTITVNLSRDELKGLIDRSNKLRVLIEQLEETEKKVYLKRLNLCQSLFVFALDSLNNE